MATDKQIEANRLNATHSTGPRTDEGREAIAQNHLNLGLFTRRDYVQPDERDFYKEFCDSFYAELGPEGHTESALATEIVAASWRLRRCSLAEGDLADYAPMDPLLDESTEKRRRSIERARASALSQFHRSMNQLRKVQTERAVRIAIYGGDMPGLAECGKVEAARQKHSKPHPKPQSEEPAGPDAFSDHFDRLLAQIHQSGSPQAFEEAELALNCQETTQTPETPEPAAIQTDEAAKEDAKEEAEAAADRESIRKFLSLDDAGQLKMLEEDRKILEADLEAILNAA